MAMITTQAMIWQARTYRSEWDLRRFLSTLSADQMAEAQVIMDDDTFVVFYRAEPSATAGAETLFGLFDEDADAACLFE